MSSTVEISMKKMRKLFYGLIFVHRSAVVHFKDIILSVNDCLVCCNVRSALREFEKHMKNIYEHKQFIFM